MRMPAILVGARMLLLVAVLLLAASCATEIAGVRISARPATRIPGTVYQDVDGTTRQIPAVDPSGDTVFIVVRARY